MRIPRTCSLSTWTPRIILSGWCNSSAVPLLMAGPQLLLPYDERPPSMPLRDGPGASPSLNTSTRITTTTDDDNNDGPRNHDTSMLPHELAEKDVEMFFPRAPVSPAPLGEADEEPDPDCADPGPFKRSGIALSAKTIAERRSPPPKAKGGSLEPREAVTALVQIDEPHMSPITACSAADARAASRESDPRASTGCIDAALDANAMHSALRRTQVRLEVPRTVAAGWLPLVPGEKALRCVYHTVDNCRAGCCPAPL